MGGKSQWSNRLQKSGYKLSWFLLQPGQQWLKPNCAHRQDIVLISNLYGTAHDTVWSVRIEVHVAESVFEVVVKPFYKRMPNAKWPSYSSTCKYFWPKSAMGTSSSNIMKIVVLHSTPSSMQLETPWSLEIQRGLFINYPMLLLYVHTSLIIYGLVSQALSLPHGKYVTAFLRGLHTKTSSLCYNRVSRTYLSCPNLPIFDNKHRDSLEIAWLENR